MRTSTTLLSTAAALALGAGGALADVSFGPGAPLAAPQRPSATAIADLNGDGFNDLAVTTDNPDKISLFTGNGAGAFVLAQTVLLGSGVGARDIIATDLDADGDIDLVVSLNNSNAVRAIINNGALSFSLGSTAPTGVDPRGMTGADFNADGSMDFAVANRDSNSVTVIINNAGTLSSASFPAGLEPRAVAAGDFDADGDMDLVVTNHDAPNIMVLTNSGAGAFVAGATYGVGPFVRPQGVAAGDVDGDGDTDLAVTLDDDDRNLHFVGIYTNTGGVFTGPVNLPTGGMNPDTVILADLDMDSDPDIAVTNQDSNTLALIQNNAGAFGPAVLSATGIRPGHVVAGDLDGNTTPDLVVTNRDSDNVSLFINQAAPPPGCPADFNADGNVNSQDFFDFLSAFFAVQPSADFNADGTVNSQDFFDFVAAFFVTCP